MALKIFRRDGPATRLVKILKIGQFVETETDTDTRPWYHTEALKQELAADSVDGSDATESAAIAELEKSLTPAEIAVIAEEPKPVFDRTESIARIKTARAVALSMHVLLVKLLVDHGVETYDKIVLKSGATLFRTEHCYLSGHTTHVIHFGPRVEHMGANEFYEFRESFRNETMFPFLRFVSAPDFFADLEEALDSFLETEVTKIPKKRLQHLQECVARYSAAYEGEENEEDSGPDWA